MDKQQYGLAVIMLASMGQIAGAFDQLDDAELENLMFLLQGALLAVARENGRRQEKRDDE